MLFNNRNLVSLILIICIMVILTIKVDAREVTYTDGWGNAGYNLIFSDAGGVEVVYSIDRFFIEDMVYEGETMQSVILPGVIIPNDPGMPNLPGTGRFIAIPEGASARVELLDYRTEIFRDIELAPAPPIPLETDDSPLVYERDEAVYSNDAYYPDTPVKISEVKELRGVDAVILGITPYQYNPVTKELVVYRDLRVRVSYRGGNGHFGDDRLRSRYWDPILRGNLLNYSMLPEIDYSRLTNLQTDEDNVEYIIIVPDDPVFIAWADTIKQWRKEQGIITGITTLTEIGGNNATMIENYINNAYNSWDVPPVAFLLLSDYQSSGDIYGITSPMWNSYCVSDNMYADVNGDDLPDIAHARITAQNEADLALMVNKFLDYERNPPTDPGYYAHPISAGGWQTERWFILCCEVVYGFWETQLGKSPVREYAIYMGTPGSSWSSNANTYMIVNYFGPSGLGYIPQTPEHLTDWGGNATRINNDINTGAYVMLHRDHGAETGWGEPAYNIGSLSGLNNDMLTFVFSINCLTGKYNWSSQCFTEAFHQMEHGALGLIAASEVSYSFVNDTYVWGMWDSMYPEFDPGYGSDLPGPNNNRPCFANAYGKHYLEASSWPYNPSNKVHTDHLFHHHGDAFITLYTEVPENLTVVHNPVLLGGIDNFSVTANDGAIISLTVNGEIIGVAEATGAPLPIAIDPQLPGNTMLVTITKQNYYRYMQEVPIIPPSGPYVVASECTVVDAAGWNPNSELEYDENVLLTLTVQNIGIETARNVEVTISSDDPLLSIIDNNEIYGNIPANQTLTVAEGFEITASSATPDEHLFIIDVLAQSDTIEWESSFVIACNSPVMEVDRLMFDDPGGNNNNWLDPGETVDMTIQVINNGHAPGSTLNGTLESLDPFLTINTTTSGPVSINPGNTGNFLYEVEASASTPQEYIANANLALTGDHSYSSEIEFGVMIGNVLYDPTGPDNYGYLAYDPYDAPEQPIYDWTEISADSGGPGSQVPFTSDDQVFHYGLPFTFQYYGVDYDSFTVGANGWIAMGIVTADDYSNSHIPDADGPERMIAPYWEDLSPQRTNSGKVWLYSDIAEHRLVIEYNHIEQYAPTGSFETFQVILFDPDYHQTISGDGRIKFQYKDMSVTAQLEGTIGIENHLENDGLEYFAGVEGETPTYNVNAHPIENEFCILFTTPTNAPSLSVTLTPTVTPIVIPPGGGTFNFDLDITNSGGSVANFDAWIEADLPGGSTYGPILLRPGINLPPGITLSRNMNQSVPGSAPAGDYTYRLNAGEYPSSVYAFDEFPFSKTGSDQNGSIEGWTITGWDETSETTVSLIPDRYYLAQNSPNPFNPLTSISFGLPNAAEVELRVFNLLGREVAELQAGFMQAGHHKITFDAGGLSSGIYFYMIKTPDFSQVKKMLLVK